MEDAGALAKLDGVLRHAGYRAVHETINGREALVARRSEFRWTWVASRVHTFVIAFVVDDLDVNDAAGLVAAAQQYAIDEKGGLPRGLQT